LTCEEDKGGVRGPIILVEETPTPDSIVPPMEEWGIDSNDERVLASLLMGFTNKWE